MIRMSKYEHRCIICSQSCLVLEIWTFSTWAGQPVSHKSTRFCEWSVSLFDLLKSIRSAAVVAAVAPAAIAATAATRTTTTTTTTVITSLAHH